MQNKLATAEQMFINVDPQVSTSMKLAGLLKCSTLALTKELPNLTNWYLIKYDTSILIPIAQASQIDFQSVLTNVVVPGAVSETHSGLRSEQGNGGRVAA